MLILYGWAVSSLKTLRCSLCKLKPLLISSLFMFILEPVKGMKTPICITLVTFHTTPLWYVFQLQKLSFVCLCRSMIKRVGDGLKYQNSSYTIENSCVYCWLVNERTWALYIKNSTYPTHKICQACSILWISHFSSTFIRWFFLFIKSNY